MNKKILVFGEALTNAHILRPWAIALELAEKGYDIYFATQKFFFKLGLKIPKTINLIELPTSIESAYFIEEVSSGRFPFTEEVLRKNILEDEKLLNKIMPDLIISDFRLSLAISNRTLKYKQATLTNLYWSPYAKISRPIPRGHIITKILGGNIGDFLSKFIQPLVLKHLANPFNKILREKKLPLFKNLLEIHAFGSKVLYCDPSGFVPHRTLPSHHFEVGPLCHYFSEYCNIRLDRKSNTLPWIFIALGSSGCHKYIEKILYSLSFIKNPIIVATSKNISKKKYSNNITFCNYIPGNIILKDSVLFITNGGSTASYLALSHGVPSLGLPVNIDQAMNSMLVKKHGVGDFLYKLKPDALRKKINFLINSKDVKMNCIRIKNQIQHHKSCNSIWNIIKNA